MPLILSSNFKSPTGEPWSVELGRHNLIVGPNASGKSAIVSAFEAATSGEFDAIMGRNGVSGAAFAIEFGDGETAWATLSRDGAAVASYAVGRDAGGTLHGPDLRGDDAFCYPLRLAREILTSGPDKARKALLGIAAADVSEEDVLALLPTALHDDYGRLAAAETGSPLDRLLATGASSEAQKRAAMTEARGAKKIVETLAGKLAESRPTDAEVARAADALTSAASVVPRRPAAEVFRELEEAREYAVAAESRLKAGHRAEFPISENALAGVLELIEYARANGRVSCPVCGDRIGESGLEHAARHFDTVYEDARSANDAAGTLDVGTAEAELVQWADRIRALQEEMVTAPDRAIEAPDLVALSSAHAALLDARSRWTQVTEAQGRVLLMGRRADMLRDLSAAISTAVTKLLGACAAKFAERVTKHMPAGWQFDIQIGGDGSKTPFRVGIRREGRFDTILSGAEWESVLAALAMALTPGEDSGKTGVVVIEDVFWDPATLKRAMKAWSAYPGFVFICAPTAARGRPLKDWNVVEASRVR